MTPHRLAALALVATLTACQQAAVAPVALDPDADTTCALDGMTLADFPGPKGQVFFENKAAPDFYCDTIELLATWLKPEQRQLVKAIYVQDMAHADWRHPVGHWVDARIAFYVTGSRAQGSMGATLASFAAEADARAFAQREGGRVVRFDEVTPDMVVMDGGVIKDRAMQ